MDYFYRSNLVKSDAPDSVCDKNNPVDTPDSVTRNSDALISVNVNILNVRDAYSLTLRQGARPFIAKERSMPLSLNPLVETELRELEADVTIVVCE